MDDNKEEIKALREFVFSLQQDQEEFEVDEPNYEKLRQISGIIIGGHQNWQNRLKDELLGWHFIGAENLNFDENLVKNAQVVFLNVNYLSHALYYKVANVVNRAGKKLYFINNQNVEKTKKEIISALKETEWL